MNDVWQVDKMAAASLIYERFFYTAVDVLLGPEPRDERMDKLCTMLAADLMTLASHGVFQCDPSAPSFAELLETAR